MTPRHPPGFLLRLLEAALPPGIAGDSMVGDLLEEWHRRDPGGRRSLWFATVVLTLSARYAAAQARSWTAGTVRAAGRALRRSLRRPVQSGLTVVVLGIGIAAPATMFSIVAGLTGDLDLEEPDRLLHLGRRFTPEVVGIAPADWLWPALDRVEGLTSVGIYTRSEVDLSDDRGPSTRLEVARVSPSVLGAFRVEPVLGRAFEVADTRGGPPPVILGWDLWRSRFGGDRGVLGRTVRLDGTPRTVMGVMPEGFDHPGGPDLWTPLNPDVAATEERDEFQAVARLAPGGTLEGVRSRLDPLNAGLRDRGEEVPAAGGVAAELWKHSLISAEDRRMLSLLVVLVGFVLVIACADVLNLLLARALGRRRETAVRVALGAGRARIVGDHLAEATVLSVLGGLLGMAITVAAVGIFEHRTAGQLAHWMDVRVDLPVLLFGAGTVALAALGTGVVPGIQASRMDVRSSLGHGGRTPSAFGIGRIGTLLVTGELALSSALLVVAGLWVKVAATDLAVAGEFATESVLTARYELRPEAYDGDEARAFHRRLLERLRSHPGVADAALASHLPGTFSPRRQVEVEGSRPEDPRDLPRAHVVRVSPSFFSTLESGVLRGRAPAWSDGREGGLAVVVNEAFVGERLEDRDPLGTRIRLAVPDDPDEEPGPWATVVGVAPPLGIDLGGRSGAGVYLPLSADPTRSTAIVARAVPGTEPLSLAPEVRTVVASMDPDLALWRIDTLSGTIRDARGVGTTFAALFVVFGVAGLLLTALGLYGLLTFTVRRRIREIGVRIALGAAPLRVLRTAVGRGLLHVGLGLALGLALAAVAAPVVARALPTADPTDPLIYGVVAGVLGLTGITAALNPARRSLQVDVVEALRTE